MILYAIGNICANSQFVPIYFPFKPIFELQRPDYMVEVEIDMKIENVYIFILYVDYTYLDKVNGRGVVELSIYTANVYRGSNIFGKGL